MSRADKIRQVIAGSSDRHEQITATERTVDLTVDPDRSTDEKTVVCRPGTTTEWLSSKLLIDLSEVR